MLCRGQVIMTGMGDVIDISILAIKAAMDIYSIQDQKNCLEKVVRLFRLNQQNRKSKSQLPPD